MKRIGIVAVSAVTLCWAMYEVSSENTNTVMRGESNQKVVSKSIPSTTKKEKLASQTLLAQTTSLNSSPQSVNIILMRLKKIMIFGTMNILTIGQLKYSH